MDKSQIDNSCRAECVKGSEFCNKILYSMRNSFPPSHSALLDPSPHKFVCLFVSLNDDRLVVTYRDRECRGFSNPPGDPPDQNTGHSKDLADTTEEGIC